MHIGYGLRFRNRRQRIDDTQRLNELGCGRVFIGDRKGPRQSGDALSRAMEFLREGDVLMVVDLDRLGASLDTIVQVVADLSARGVSVAADEAGIVPGSPLGEQFGAACAALAKTAQTLQAGAGTPRQRRTPGRPVIFSDEDQILASRMLADGRVSVLDIARQLNVSPATIYRYFPRRKPGK